MLQPTAHKVVPPPQAERVNPRRGPCCLLRQGLRQRRVPSLVRIQYQQPEVLVGHFTKTRIALPGIAVKHPLVHMRAMFDRDGGSPVRAEGIQHMHVVGPRNRPEAARQIPLLILGDNQNRQHRLRYALPHPSAQHTVYRPPVPATSMVCVALPRPPLRPLTHHKLHVQQLSRGSRHRAALRQ